MLLYTTVAISAVHLLVSMLSLCCWMTAAAAVASPGKAMMWMLAQRDVVRGRVSNHEGGFEPSV